MVDNHVINDISNYAEPGPDSLEGVSRERFTQSESNLLLLQWACQYFYDGAELRKKWKRAQDFVMGRQLEELIEWNGRKITIRQYMEMKGMPILEYDVIGDKLLSLVGLVRQQRSTATCSAVDPNEEDYISFFNEYLRQNDNLNDRQELDARMFYAFCCFAFIGMKTYYGRRDGKNGIFDYSVDIFKLALPPFFKYDLSDVEFIAEAHDLTWREIIATFTNGSKEEANKLSEIYLQTQHHFAPEQTYHPTGEAQYAGIDDFTHSSVVGKYRVLEIWTKETRPAIWVHDWESGDCGYASPDQRAFYEEKKRKIEESNIMKDENGLPVLDENGEPIYYVDPSELKTIEIKDEAETYWFRRYITPNGYLLDARESPYYVLRDGFRTSIHPYTFVAYPCLNGEVRSFTMRAENNQRTLNHYMMMINFIVANGAKGTMLVDENALSEKQSLDEMQVNYTKTDSIILWNSKNGGKPPQTLVNKSIPAGVDFMVNFAKTMASEGSGVQGALQGQHRNTSGKQYQLERESSSTTIQDFVESFNNFKVRVAKKKLYLIQEFCTAADSVKLTGDDFEIHFNPETMRDMDLDVAIDLDAYSPIIRATNNDMAWNFMTCGKMDPYTMLTVGQFPGTSRMKKYFKEQLEKLQAMQAQQQANGEMPIAGAGQQQTGTPAAHLKDGNGGTNDLAALPSASTAT